MADFNTAGIEGLSDALEHIAEIPEEVLYDMLHAEADVVVKSQKEELERTGLKDTGQLMDSIARARVRGTGKDAGAHLDVYPQGTRENGVRNAEVGFIHEFGAPERKIPASGWMESANEKCADEAVGAAEAVYHGFLDKNNL